MLQAASHKPDWTGCPCGHEFDEDCVRHKPIPSPPGCGGCTALDLQQIESCRRRGFYCTERTCALRSLIAAAA